MALVVIQYESEQVDLSENECCTIRADLCAVLRHSVYSKWLRRACQILQPQFASCPLLHTKLLPGSFHFTDCYFVVFPALRSTFNVVFSFPFHLLSFCHFTLSPVFAVHKGLSNPLGLQHYVLS